MKSIDNASSLTPQQQLLHNASVGQSRLRTATGTPESLSDTVGGGTTSILEEARAVTQVVRAKFMEAIGGEDNLIAYKSAFIKDIMDSKGDTPQAKEMIKFLDDDDEVISLILELDDTYDYGADVTGPATEATQLEENTYGKTTTELKL